MGRINKPNKTTPVSADEFIIYDSQDTTDDKNITLGQVASFTENQNSTITGAKVFSNASSSYSGNGSGLTNLNASNIASGTINSNYLPVIPASKGGTGLSSVTYGGIIYGKNDGGWNGLAPNITTVKKFLTQTGTGSIGAIPTWSTLTNNDLPNNIVTCSTASATAEKLIIMSGVTLATGLVIQVIFTNANTASTPTINFNGTVDAIYNKAGNPINANNPAYFNAGSIIEFIFNGTNWIYKKNTGQYISTQQTISALATPIIVTHNLNLPNVNSCYADVVGICLVAEGGYSIGDIVTNLGCEVASSDVRPLNVVLSSTTVRTIISSTGLRLCRKDTGAAYNAAYSNWALIFRIWY